MNCINPNRQCRGEDDDPHPFSAVVTITEHGVLRVGFLQQACHFVGVSEVIACEYVHLPRLQVLQKQEEQSAAPSLTLCMSPCSCCT